MKSDSTKRNKLYAFAIVIGCVLAAGPELGIGLELLATVELLGFELFVFCFIAPLWFFLYRLESWFQRFDPYFFIPTRQQILSTPGILAHALPGSMVLLLWWASIFVFTS